MLTILVLLVEVGEVNNQILDHKHVRKRGNGGRLRSISIYWLETSYSVATINVHCTGSTYSFPA